MIEDLPYVPLMAVGVFLLLALPAVNWQRAGRWLGWRLSRPMLDSTDYPRFKRDLALWKERKPR